MPLHHHVSVAFEALHACPYCPHVRRTYRPVVVCTLRLTACQAAERFNATGS